MILLRELDLFKAVPDTRFKGQKGGHSSIFGRTLTLMILAVAIGLLVYFSLDMLLKTNPQIQTFASTSNKDLILNNNTFPFAFGLRDKSGNYYIDETIYSVNAYFNSNKKKVAMTPCKPTVFPGVYDPEKEGPVWCFSDQQDFNEIGINSAGGIQIDFLRCDSTKTANCKNSTDFDSIVFKSKLRIIYLEVASNLQNYQEPIEESARTWDPTVVKTMVKQSILYVTQNEFITNDGWLLKNDHKKSKITVDERVQYFEDVGMTPNAFKTMRVRTYGEIKTSQRIYDNLQNVLARWNAIFTLLIVLGKILSDSYNKFKTQETLVKDIFFLKKKNPRKRHSKRQAKDIAKLPSSPQGPRESISLCGDISEHKIGRDEFMPLSSNITSPMTSRKKTLRSVSEMDPRFVSLVPIQRQKPFLGPHLVKINVEENKDQEKSIASPEKNHIFDLLDSERRLQTTDRHASEDLRVNDNAKPMLDTQTTEKRMDTEALETEGALIGDKETSDKEAIKKDLFQYGRGVSFYGWLCSKIKKTEQYNLHLKREEIIQAEFDFQNYAKRFIGIDVLKYLLLSKEQLMVFDNCVKAYVNLKLDSLTKGSASDDVMFDDLRVMLNTEGFTAEDEDLALHNLKKISNPDETTKKTLHLLEVLYKSEK